MTVATAVRAVRDPIAGKPADEEPPLRARLLVDPPTIENGECIIRVAMVMPRDNAARLLREINAELEPRPVEWLKEFQAANADYAAAVRLRKQQAEAQAVLDAAKDAVAKGGADVKAALAAAGDFAAAEDKIRKARTDLAIIEDRIKIIVELLRASEQSARQAYAHLVGEKRKQWIEELAIQQSRLVVDLMTDGKGSLAGSLYSIAKIKEMLRILSENPLDPERRQVGLALRFD